MRKNFWLCWVIVLLSSNLLAQAPAPWTWEQVRQRFEQNNPTLQAGKLSVDEAKANEITAFLRPNPTMSILADQIDPFGGGPEHGPFSSSAGSRRSMCGPWG